MGQTFARLVRAGLSLIMPIAVGRIWQKPPALFICGNVSKWIRTPFFSFLNGIWRVLAYARSRTLFICGRTWRTTVHLSCARNPCLLRSLTSWKPDWRSIRQPAWVPTIVHPWNDSRSGRERLSWIELHNCFPEGKRGTLHSWFS